MTSKKYEYLPHTADMKIRCWGDTIDEAFINAGKAFTDATIDIDKVECRFEDNIDIEGADLEELLYNFIEELIVRLDVDRKVYRDFKLRIEKAGKGFKLLGMACGEFYDREKHGSKIHVKAMTYHEMKIFDEGNRVIIEYVVDI